MHNSIYKRIIGLLGVVILALLFVSPVHAQTISVDFERDPLFGNVNFLPGDVETGDVEVSNETNASQDVYAESVNGLDPDGLGDQMRLRILEGAYVIYDDIFSNFLSGGPIPLSSIAPEEDETYTFEVSFINSADNDYMGKSLGFDLCVGFSGGNLLCGDTVTSPENPIPPPPPGGGGGGSSGGGGGGQFLSLEIFNENATVTFQGTPTGNADGTALITWNTNLLATSQVVYGLASGAPYTLNLDNPNFGYPLSTVEDPNKVTYHTVPLFDLIEGQTYVYRVVSRASPPTVSPEYHFTLGQSIAQANNFTANGSSNTSGIPSTGSGQVEGELQEEEFETLGGEPIESSEPVTQAAAAFLAGLSFDCIGIAVLIFIIAIFLTRFIIKKSDQDLSLEKEFGLLVFSAVLSSIILWMISYTCPITPLWILVIIYIVWKYFSRRKDGKDK